MLTAFAWPFLELLGGLVMLIILWRGGVMVINEYPVSRPYWDAGSLAWKSVPFAFWDLLTFILYLGMMTFPLYQMGWTLTLFQRGAAGMNRIIEIMAEQPAIRDSDTVRKDINTIHGDIRFENVQFGYHAGQHVLADISMAISAGQTVAIVGPTGSGKSSIIRLLVREYDVTGGRVLVDGVDIREIPLAVLHGAIGYVPQDAFLFSDSIRNNLAFGRSSVSERELWEVLEMVQMKETVANFPQGLDTMLGERGINLSGGQKQRLTIARALLRDPSILILDDALSSVDTDTEEKILARLRHFMKNRTSILIAHRISTVAHADRIFVIADGNIAEQGTHEELLARGGLYADMQARQLLEKELEQE